MATDLDEVTKALEDSRRDFEEFKKTNDARIAALKREGGIADFEEKLDRINAALDKQERVNRKFIAEQENKRLELEADRAAFKAEQEAAERKMEARVNRYALKLTGGEAADEHTGQEILARRAYQKLLRVPDHSRLTEEERKVLRVADDPAGGYLAPPSYAAQIIEAVTLFSPIRTLVNVQNISTGEWKQPKRNTAPTASRVAETGTRSETTNPAWGLVSIQTPEMFAEARISMAMLEDSAYDLETILAKDFGEAFGVLEGSEFVNGTGVGTLHGILDASAAGPSTAIANTVSGSASTIAGASGAEAAGLIDLFHAVKTVYAVRGKWIMNRGSLGKVRKLKDTTGQYLWSVGIAPGSPNTILGAPYVECSDMPDEGSNAYPIAFGDWERAYTIAQRIDLSIVRDGLTLASSGQVKFSARRRVGGRVVLGEAIRLLKCST